MLPYIFTNHLFVRSPANSVTSFQHIDLQFQLTDPFFKAAIYFASPALYEQLELKGFKIEAISPGAKDSLWKYFNRMCYRATPFGLFSSFSCTNWGNGDCSLVFRDSETFHVKMDFRSVKKIADEVLGDHLSSHFYSNPSIYKVGGELRYLKRLADGESEFGAFGVSAIKYSRLVHELLILPREGWSSQQIKDFLLQSFPNNDPQKVLDEFILEGLIHDKKLPNVTGEYFLERLARETNHPQLRRICRSLQILTKSIGKDLKNVKEIAGAVEGDSEIKSAFYVNYFRNVTGTLNDVYQSKMLQGINCLFRMHETNEDNPLGTFRKRFLEKFDMQEISLMFALDPDVGVAYGELEGSASEEQLLKDLNFQNPQPSKKIYWGKVQTMLINKITVSCGNSTIVLADDDLTGLNSDARAVSSGISVMFRIHEKKVFIESAGGAGSTSLIGRFTAFDDEILKQARHINKREANGRFCSLLHRRFRIQSFTT